MPTVAEIKERIKKLRGKSKDYPITGLNKSELMAVLDKLEGPAPAKNLRELTVAHYQKKDEEANKIVRTKRDEALGNWADGIMRTNAEKNKREAERKREEVNVIKNIKVGSVITYGQPSGHMGDGGDSRDVGYTVSGKVLSIKKKLQT